MTLKSDETPEALQKFVALAQEPVSITVSRNALTVAAWSIRHRYILPGFEPGHPDRGGWWEYADYGEQLAQQFEAAMTEETAGKKSAAKRGTKRDDGLFPSEQEIARRLSQQLNEWRAKSIILERDGLPKIDPLMGDRYWPAVQAYFDRRHGIGAGTSTMVDGSDNLDAL